ncbi:hypothetical protein METHB2_340021 [Candidatus Methylobacter favarea]|uniref:Uncharacterized protein n=1 Tax=Candidatus Methylobacter favarea TaxID=2707345 RepID=A0A8S0Y6D6_9GAMM|nr:hypothetical protein [Candidatus Methylobacter favarea]CAA9891103.1 hypothetical protein METHB2_340021 [Candidatus Methylobacter favarea]
MSNIVAIVIQFFDCVDITRVQIVVASNFQTLFLKQQYSREFKEQALAEAAAFADPEKSSGRRWRARPNNLPSAAPHLIEAIA